MRQTTLTSKLDRFCHIKVGWTGETIIPVEIFMCIAVLQDENRASNAKTRQTVYLA